MRKSLSRLALAGAAVTVLAAGVAVAQIPAPPAPPAPPEAPPPPPPPHPPMDMMAMGPDMMGPGGDMMFMRHHGRPDPAKRAQRLRDVLQLRPDQDGALKAYVDATSPKIEIHKEEAKADKKDGEMAERAPPTTLERLDHMTKAADAMKKRAEATRSFYLSLTPSQQKTFDVLGLDEGPGAGEHIVIRRLETHGAPVFKGERKVVTQRKVG